MKRVFLIHGWEGRPDNHWFPYLTLELKANGFDVSAPQMPHAAEPKVAEWLAFLKDYVGKPDEETYFVGHSLGCITIARYLAELSSYSPSLRLQAFPKGSTASSQEGILPFVKGVPPSSAGRDFSKSSLWASSPRALAVSKTRPPSFKKGGVKIGGCVFVAGFSGRLNIPEIREFYELPFDPEQAKVHCGRFTMIFSDNDSYVPMEKSLEFAKQLDAKTILERGKGHFTTGDGVTALPSVLSALLKIAEGS